MKLGAFGWHEAVRREQKGPRFAAATSEQAADLHDYLERMGVRWAGALCRERHGCSHQIQQAPCAAASNSHGRPCPALVPLYQFAPVSARRSPPNTHTHTHTTCPCFACRDTRLPPRPRALSGQSDAAIRQRLAAALPVADLEQISAASLIGTPVGPLRPAQLLRPLSRPESAGPSRRPTPLPMPLIVIPGE